ncbi:DUF5011 domain-containing protein [Listeria sp. FSL L7-1485]|uniref:DUF5011 domain-containing protein n=1 Tax=Listeria immobilis TaxID=2713502 RepID=A0A7X0X7B4_9LIST|nr:bacterial Ig-like domain-containing protein [Listeria immobilis]MBC1488979.1 DUF5011 domain-containing protein [Listeria immobilis]MBC1536276.1 DUF5011 domain-containing protein [Listeria immobilis]
MIRTTRIKRSLLVVMTLLLILTQMNLGAFHAFAEEKDNDSVSYEVQSELSSDKKKAKLQLKATSKQEQVKILSVETPDGEVIQGELAEYTAEENGTVQFLINYQDTGSEQEPITKTYTATYDVTGIVSETKENTAENNTTSQENNTSQENTTTSAEKSNLKGLQATNTSLTLDIPNYDQTAWANGDIKTVNVTVDFKDSTSTGKKVKFTLPDGMRFVSIPVPNNYKATSGVDKSVLSYLGAGDPLGSATTSLTVPSQETTYGKATYGTVSYELDPGTEKASFSFSVRVDAAKYYGTTDLQTPIKAEAFMGDSSTPIASSEQSVHAEGNSVVGYAYQNHVKTMFRSWYGVLTMSETLASTDTTDSYNYTKTYSVVNGLNEVDGRGSSFFIPKHVTTTLYYPEGMEYVGVVDAYGTLRGNTANKTITHVPSENKVVIDYKQLNYFGADDTIYAIKYKIPKGTPAGTYTAPKVPHSVITTYDDKVFETDALITQSSNVTTLVEKDVCKVVDTAANKMTLTTTNRNINPDNETWAGNIRIENKTTAGVKTNQVYHVKFDENWEAYTSNLPFDGTISGNKITKLQYKTNLNPNYQTYSGTLPKTNANRMATLDAKAVGLQDGEYFTEIQANVGDFSPGYMNTSPSATFSPQSSISYGKVKTGINSVKFSAEIWDADDEANTKVSGVSTYSVNNTITSSANGRATFYNEDGVAVKTARAGETLTTKASLLLFEYPYGTRTVLNNPNVYLRAIDGTKILPASIKLTDQDGQDVDFTVKAETANNGDKVYVLKTNNVSVGGYIGYPSKTKYLNLTYDTTIDVTLDRSINTDAQEMIAWDAIAASAVNYFPDTGLDVNKNGNTNERLISVNSSTLSIPKQDTVTVETFLNVDGEGAKSAYIAGDDTTVSYFTPGTNADYTVQITNTSSSNASTFELYIPIPKTGQNFGSKFQREAFKWDMKLNGALPVTAEQQSQFEISYATTATEANYQSEDIYAASLTNYENVNMVRMKVKTQINAGETQIFKVPLKVDETFDSATAGNKISERDVYNPFYRVITNTFSGTLPGTTVGAELVIAEVSGQLFNDKDANGLYEAASGDEPLANETVELYKWNEASSSYEAYVNNGENVTTKTNANGTYKFDYHSGIAYGKYAVKFPSKAGYQYTLQDVSSNNAVNSNVAFSGANKGWVKDINPTQPTAQSISAGYLEYEPNQDLKVNLNEKLVQSGNSLKVTLPKVALTSGVAAEDTIEPAFFQNIQAATNGYKWTSGDTNIATVQTLSDGSAAIVGVSTNGKTIATTDLMIELQDVYGTKTTSTAPVFVTETNGTVTQKDGFTIGATNFAIEYKAAAELTESQALSLAKTAAFEEVKNGVNSSAEDRSSLIQVNAAQLAAIQKGSNQGGTYPLTYTVTKDGKTAEVVIQVTVAKDLTAVNAHDSTIYVGDTWTATDNFDSALNKAGDAVNWSDIQTTGTVNTNTAGNYPITYTYAGISKTINVTVKDNLTAVNTHDSTIYTGDVWNAKDNFDSALDKDGNLVELKDITVTGTVDTTKADKYEITYTYAGISSKATVIVKENKKGVSAHDSTMYVGDNWTAKDNFDSAFDKDGNAVNFDDVQVTEKPTVNTNKAGSYQITYSYDGASKTITLTVKDIQTAVNAHDLTIYTGDSWNAKDNFDSALDKDGQTVSFQDIQVTGTVDAAQAGVYPVSYSYDGLTTTINVTVKTAQTAIQAHDSLIYTGDTWNAKDNFDSAVDKKGQAVDFQDVTVSETPNVDMETPGVYQVTYSYNGVSTTINVTVEPRQTSLTVHDTTIYAGTKWSTKDNFDSATDKKGDSVSLSDITVSGSVDYETPGTYEISYLYDGVKAVAHVTVLENHAKIIVKDSNLSFDAKWDAKDNFISATNREGVEINFSQVKVSGTVNTNKAGTYKVTYTIDPNEGTVDAGKEEIQVVATIVVAEKPTSQPNPAKPNKPSKGTTTLTVTSTKQHAATYKDAKPLPKTGDQSNNWTIWAGICLLGIGLLMSGFLYRRRKQQ